MVIKLAERIAHLREVKDAPEDERVLAAKECSNIYAPLANRLGIGQLKWGWRILPATCHPEEYNASPSCCMSAASIAKQFIDDFVAGLRTEIASEGIRVRSTAGRNTSASGARCRKSTAFDELVRRARGAHRGRRLQDCYAALGIVHTHFRHLPDERRLRRQRKPNGYQSIHTVVLGPRGKTVEIQIRTRKCMKTPSWAWPRTGSTKRARA